MKDEERKELTDEELDAVAAGREVNWVDALKNRDNKDWVINNANRVIPPIYCCPKCRSRNVHNYDLGNAFVMRVQCHDCDYYGERGAISETEIKYFVNITESKFIITIDIAFNKINHIFNETELKNMILVSAGDSMPLYMRALYQITKGRRIKLEHNDSIIRWRKFIDLGKDHKEPIKSNFKGCDVAAVLYSGGTTGYPKGIELTNLNFNALAMQSFEACACLCEKDKVLSIMPVFHGFGLGICIHTVQYFGGTSILLPHFSAKTFDKLLKNISRM